MLSRLATFLVHFLWLRSTSQFCRGHIQDGPRKRGHRLVTIILSNLNRLKNSLEDYLVNLQLKCILKIPPHLKNVATLPCETLMSAKQALNDKLQGSLAAYLRCDGVVNNQIKKSFLLSVNKKKF